MIINTFLSQKLRKSLTPVIFATSILMAVPVNVSPAKIQKTGVPDTYAYANIPLTGTTDSNILDYAPKPDIKVAGQKKKAAIVVDLSKNILYHYDKDGKPISAYPIASGSAQSPTHSGIRQVSHVETYPYRTAPYGTKRRRNPRAYGPKIIILNKVDPKTGETSQTGEFIHGNNDVSSIRKYVSHGCMRMDNDVINLLSGIVRRGDYVNILPNNK